MEEMNLLFIPASLIFLCALIITKTTEHSYQKNIFVSDAIAISVPYSEDADIKMKQLKAHLKFTPSHCHKTDNHEACYVFFIPAKKNESCTSYIQKNVIFICEYMIKIYDHESYHLLHVHSISCLNHIFFVIFSCCSL